MKKRILSLVMALTMALTLLPMAAFAANTADAGNDAYANGSDSYIIEQDTVTLTITKNWVNYPDPEKQIAEFEITYLIGSDVYYVEPDTAFVVGNDSVAIELPKGAQVSITELDVPTNKTVDVAYTYGNDADTEYVGYHTGFYALNSDTEYVFTNTLLRHRLSGDHDKLNTSDHFAYIIGYPDGTVRPDNDITRAEVATIFFRLLTEEVRNDNWSKDNSFSDVSDGQWFNNAISTLEKGEIVNGYPDGSFRPNTQITRAEFATMAVRFLDDSNTTGGPEFSDVAGHWAEDYIAKAAANGLIEGYGDGTFRPDNDITRAEAITLINRLLGCAPDADHFVDGMLTWTDNVEGKWYYAAVQEATNSHEYYISITTDKEVWIRLIDSPDWYSLEKSWADLNDDTAAE